MVSIHAMGLKSDQIRESFNRRFFVRLKNRNHGRFSDMKIYKRSQSKERGQPQCSTSLESAGALEWFHGKLVNLR